MKFNSKKGFLPAVLIWSVSLFLVVVAIEHFIHKNEIKWMAIIIIILPALFLLWIWFDTNYKIEDNLFKYKSGPIRGSIKIENITTVVLNKTLYVGVKPALSFKGCIIKYNRWDEIYISPVNIVKFYEELLRVNPKIKVMQ